MSPSARALLTVLRRSGTRCGTGPEPATVRRRVRVGGCHTLHSAICALPGRVGRSAARPHHSRDPTFRGDGCRPPPAAAAVREDIGTARRYTRSSAGRIRPVVLSADRRVGIMASVGLSSSCSPHPPPAHCEQATRHARLPFAICYGARHVVCRVLRRRARLVALDRRVDVLRPGVDAAGEVVDVLEALLEEVLGRAAAAAAVVAVERDRRVLRQRSRSRPSSASSSSVACSSMTAMSRSFGGAHVVEVLDLAAVEERLRAPSGRSRGPPRGRFGLSILKPAPVASSTKSIVHARGARPRSRDRAAR